MVRVIGRQLELKDESGKTHKVNVYDVKSCMLVDEMIKCSPVEKAFGHAVTYCSHQKHLEDLHWSLNKNILHDI